MVARRRASKPATKKVQVRKAARAPKLTRTLKSVASSHAAPPRTAAGRPCIIGRNLALVDGQRHARRPSKVARASNSFNAPEVSWAGDSWEQPETWLETSAGPMPKESKDEDQGWQVGPVTRPLPPFLGPTPGPVDDTLDSSSSVVDFVSTRITDEFAQKVVVYTRLHCEHWRVANPDWRTDAREIAMKKPKKHFGKEEFRLWLACRLRISQMKPEIPALTQGFLTACGTDTPVCLIVRCSMP